VRFQERLRRLALIDERFVEHQARPGLDLAHTSALDPKTAALLRVECARSSGRQRCAWDGALGEGWWRTRVRTRSLTCWVAIAPVAGPGWVAAAPEAAVALGSDIAVALEDWTIPDRSPDLRGEQSRDHRIGQTWPPVISQRRLESAGMCEGGQAR
jgi:hypothetical protein